MNHSPGQATATTERMHTSFVRLFENALKEARATHTIVCLSLIAMTDYSVEVFRRATETSRNVEAALFEALTFAKFQLSQQKSFAEKVQGIHITASKKLEKRSEESQTVLQNLFAGLEDMVHSSFQAMTLSGRTAGAELGELQNVRPQHPLYCFNS